MSIAPVITFSDLTFGYQPRQPVLEFISLSIKKSEFVALIGTNGGGKTTLLKLITGLEKPQKGTVTVSESRIGYVPQRIGSFLVVRRYSLMADTLSHASLVGVAAGIVLHTSPMLVSVIVTSVAAVLIKRLRSRNLFGEGQLLAVFLSGSLALAILLISLSDAGNVNLMSYLFGSITNITCADLITIGVLAAGVLTVIGLCYKELFITSFDPEYAQVFGISTGAINILFIVLVAVTVTLAIRIVGVPLIGSLMIIPVLTAITFTRSFRTKQPYCTMLQSWS